MRKSSRLTPSEMLIFSAAVDIGCAAFLFIACKEIAPIGHAIPGAIFVRHDHACAGVGRRAKDDLSHRIVSPLITGISCFATASSMIVAQLSGNSPFQSSAHYRNAAAGI